MRVRHHRPRIRLACIYKGATRRCLFLLPKQASELIERPKGADEVISFNGNRLDLPGLRRHHSLAGSVPEPESANPVSDFAAIDGSPSRTPGSPSGTPPPLRGSSSRFSPTLNRNPRTDGVPDRRGVLRPLLERQTPPADPGGNGWVRVHRWPLVRGIIPSLNRSNPPSRRPRSKPERSPLAEAPAAPAVLDLHWLDAGTPGITPAWGAYLRQAASVCLEEQNHPPGVEMPVEGALKGRYAVSWRDVTAQVRRCLGDPEVATEHGAYGIAALVVASLTGLTVIERSRKGTGFDFWLGPRTAKSGLFQRRTRLEVSGIRDNSDGVVEGRVKQKLEQTRQSDGLGLPALVVVVEFGTPLSRVAKR